MERRYLKIIKIGIILVLLVILVICILILFSNKYYRESNEDINQQIDTEIKFSKVFTKSNSISEYKNLNNCLNVFLDYIYKNDTEAIYNILTQNFIKEENITKSNAINKFDKISYNCEYMVKSIYRLENNARVITYFVSGNILNKDKKTNKEYNYIINLDMVNNTFSLAPYGNTYIKYIEYNGNNVNIINNKFLDNSILIEKNQYNNIDILSALRRKTNNVILF